MIYAFVKTKQKTKESFFVLFLNIFKKKKKEEERKTNRKSGQLFIFTLLLQLNCVKCSRIPRGILINVNRGDYCTGNIVNIHDFRVDPIACVVTHNYATAVVCISVNCAPGSMG